MSEYQYYEFQALDRRLTQKEMSDLRSYSSRARITPTGFVVDYSFGSFKGNEDAWMEKYFDAYLHMANWGTHLLKLRLPTRLLDVETAAPYCVSNNVSLREKNGQMILSFVSQDEDGGGDWVDGEGWLSSVVGVRAELARGDHRALYLAWLLCAQTGDLDDEEIEPPVPPGLANLSAPLSSLVEFLRIDEDLVTAAAAASYPLDDSEPTTAEVRSWLFKLPQDEKNELLERLVIGREVTLADELLQRMRREDKQVSEATTPPSRTVAELLKKAEEAGRERRRLEAEKAAREKARREREAAIARERHLEELTGTEPTLWKQVTRLIATKQPKRYDEAVALLADLRDLAARAGGGDFGIRLEALRAEHARKGTLIDRIRKAGL